MIAVCALVFVVAAYNLGSYGWDYLASKRASRELRAAYYAAETQAPTAAVSAIPATATPEVPSPTPVPTETIRPNAVVSAVAHATNDPDQPLPNMAYPQNPYHIISSRFKSIRRQNADIIGWLKIGDEVDEAVVQRDNSYYLRRDYRGYHNVNGAIFLDEACDLKEGRPYALLLYGHNMKTGAMFGCLRNYENVQYYRNAPFLTFDTIYEEGKYVVFAVSHVSTVRTAGHYLDFWGLASRNRARRQDAIMQLKRNSAISNTLEVTPEDQILLLITCVDDADERRVVAARRIRDGESEDELQRIVNRARGR